jgi:transcriptional regulator with XRE-family HTH domain
MRTQKKTFVDSIRAAILDAKKRGLSRYAISQLTGCPQSSFSAFVHGRQGISVELLDALADLLGLKLVVDARVQQARAAAIAAERAAKQKESAMERAAEKEAERAAEKDADLKERQRLDREDERRLIRAMDRPQKQAERAAERRARRQTKKAPTVAKAKHG